MLNNATCFDKIILITGYSDLRKGIDGLAGLIKYKYNLDPFEKDVLYLFCGRNSRKLKGLVWEGDGFLLLAKRLEANHFSSVDFLFRHFRDSAKCSAHFIREKVVYQMVLAALRRIFKMISVFEEEFIELQTRHYGAVRKNKLSAKKRELSKAKARIQEFGRIIQKSYEDNANGIITDERYATLTSSLETE